MASRPGGAVSDCSDRLFYRRDGRGRELDFVLRDGRSPVPAEAEFQDTFSRRDLAPVVRFLDAASAEKGLVVSKSALEERSDYGGARVRLSAGRLTRAGRARPRLPNQATDAPGRPCA